MVKIKLSRTGKRHQPSYRVVVIEAKSKRDGAYIENLGHYNPLTKEWVLDQALYAKWIGQGAQPTETVARLVAKHTTKAA